MDGKRDREHVIHLIEILLISLKVKSVAEVREPRALSEMRSMETGSRKIIQWEPEVMLDDVSF